MNNIFDQIYRDFFTVSGQTKDGFPFYNLVKKDDQTFEIRMALSGYKMSDIEVVVSGEQLAISSAGVDERSEVFLHKGYTGRPFFKKFVLNPGARVKSADFVDGVLTVAVERIVQENARIRKIAINQPSTSELLHG